MIKVIVFTPKLIPVKTPYTPIPTKEATPLYSTKHAILLYAYVARINTGLLIPGSLGEGGGGVRHLPVVLFSMYTWDILGEMYLRGGKSLCSPPSNN